MRCMENPYKLYGKSLQCSMYSLIIDKGGIYSIIFCHNKIVQPLCHHTINFKTDKNRDEKDFILCLLCQKSLRALPNACVVSFSILRAYPRGDLSFVL